MKSPLPQRHTTCLPGCDYTQPGAYFVTITAAERAARFGVITNGEMRQNAVGTMVQREWLRLPQRFPGLNVDTFIIMPDHVHGIIIIEEFPVHTVGAQRCQPTPVPSTPALRPSHQHPSASPNDSHPRAQPLQRGPMPDTASLRPYGDKEFCGDEGLDPVGAQQCKTEHTPSTTALRPSQEPHMPPVSPDRPQRFQRGSTPVTPSLRPYGESEPQKPSVAAGSLGAIVRAFKSATTLRYHHMKGAEPGPLWQRNYYEHIIRSQAEMETIYAYIQNNPAQWEDSQK